MHLTNKATSFDNLSWLVNARLLRPKICDLTLHSHLQSMKLPIENLIPTPNLQNPIGPDSIYTHLLMNPLIATAETGDGWQIISGIFPFHQARLHLDKTNRIPVLVVNEVTNDQIDQLITHEFIINKIIEQPTNQKDCIWENKQRLEKIGTLNALGLHGKSKQKWASWLNCDRRSLHD